MRRFRPRHAVLHLAAIALGIATTTAVAWRLAILDIRDIGARSDQQIRPTRHPVHQEIMGGPADGLSTRVFVERGRIAAMAWCYGPGFRRPLGTPFAQRKEPFFSPLPPDELVPWSVRSRVLPWLNGYEWPRGADVDWREVRASGWPLIALATELRLAPNYTYERKYGIVLSGRGTRMPGQRSPSTDRILPLLPLWPNFAIDTLAYAAIWFPMLLMPGMLRRAHRRRRGACVNCGYDIRGLAPTAVCPECGDVPTSSPTNASAKH